MMGTRVPASLLTKRTVGLINGLFILSTAMFVMTVTSSAMSVKFTGAVGFGMGFPSFFLFSCCAKSMMLDTRSRSREAQPLTMPSCRCKALPASDCNMAPARPTMPCNGLLISCDSIAMRADFRSWMMRSWVMSERSWPMPITPAASPSFVDLGTRVIANWRAVCAGCVVATADSVAPASMLATTGIDNSTKFPVHVDVAWTSSVSSFSSLPDAISNTFWMVFSKNSRLSGAATSTNGLPRTSSRVRPVSLVKLSFHSMMLPSRSNANTGTRAWVIKLSKSLLAVKAATHQCRIVVRSSRWRIIASSAPWNTLTEASV
mmetsp:Transcript_28886/g.83657  ORF Transcript_28886/g.83657 Transcript_28886/m.83657 type:complete len:318 (-) Transcript_28886:1001-1954(-)